MSRLWARLCCLPLCEGHARRLQTAEVQMRTVGAARSCDLRSGEERGVAFRRPLPPRHPGGRLVFLSIPSCFGRAAIARKRKRWRKERVRAARSRRIFPSQKRKISWRAKGKPSGPRGEKASGLLRIGVVDDCADEREVLNDLLITITGGQRVLEAGDAQSALLGIIEHKPDLVLLDLRLPGMSGLDCARRLKTVAPDLKIIAITGFADEASVNDALNLGVSGFLTKPISRRALADALKVAVDGGIYLSPGLRRFFHAASAAEPRATSDPASVLTPREREVVALLASGLE